MKWPALILSLLVVLCPSHVIADSEAPQTQPPRVLSEQEQIVPYWTMEPGWHTELELGSNLASEELKVELKLITSDGTGIELNPVSVRPGEMRVIDLEQLAQAANAPLANKANSFGSLLLRYRSQHSANLYGSATLYRDGAPIAFHIPAEETGGAPDSIRGWHTVWWLPGPNSDGHVIVTNTDAVRASLQVSLLAPDARRFDTQVELGPRESKRMSLRDLMQRAKIESGYGGLTLSSVGDVNLQVTGLLFDETNGFSAMMRIFPVIAERSSGTQTMIAPVVALTRPDSALGFPPETRLSSYVSLWNVGVEAITPTMTVNWKNERGPGRAAVPVQRLAPGAMQLISLSELQKQGLLPADQPWTAATVSFSGDPSDLVALTASYNDDGRYGLQSPFSYSVAPHWKGGRWRVGDEYNTLGYR